jgi:hypothetical protein
MAGTLTVDTIQSDSSYASTLNVTSKINFSGGMQIGGQDTTFGGMRNRVINGNMLVWQRATSITGSTNYNTVDRWDINGASGSTLNVAQSTDVPAGFTYSTAITVGTASSASGAYAYMLQQIEGYNVADLDFGLSTAKPATLSFWVKSSVTGTYGMSFRNTGTARFLTSTYTINSANTWEQKTITIVGDTTGTWLKTNGSGLTLIWDLGVGSTYSSTSNNAWSTVGSNYFGVTGTTKLASTAGATFYITGVQLEKGSTATQFEFRSFATELALCMRYFERSYDYGQYTYSGEIMKGIASFGSPHISTGASTNIMDAFMKLFLVPKRTQPTITGYSLTDGVAGKWRRYYTGVSPADDQNVTFNNISTTGAEVTIAAGGNCNIVLGHWVASAEL